MRRVEEDSIDYVVHLCDEEAAALVNEIPSPFYVKEIRHLYEPKTLLFYNRFLQRQPAEPKVKPMSLVEKNAYWAAKATERWTPRVQ